MHEYSIDVEHNKILFYLSALSILFSGIIATLLNVLIEKIPFIEFTVSITAIGIFGILHSLFNKFIWKWKFLKTIGIVKVPDLNGKWKGEFRSSFHNFDESFPVILIIEQTWSKICIRGKFNHSKSSSNTASLKINEGGGIKLLYSYYNDKDPQYYEIGTSNHRGYASLEINEDSMEGHYFNDPTNNKNHGKLTLSKRS
ncbi:hypothetical protein ACFPFV_04150 [Salinicoccus siamensis]|uniref:SMODS-associating 2TM beta-strand rich effector domain-containing protein n=1 Tax=Salinicoccus siamensis TaxID=381830 RepID=A0ABV5Z5G6_9STAP